MSRNSWVDPSCLLFVVVGVMVIGFMVPTFYDWSGVDQSHSTPEADRAWHFVLGFVLLTWLALPWSPGPREVRSKLATATGIGDHVRRFQFNVRTLLVIMSVIAVAIVGLSRYRLSFALLLICSTIVFSIWMVAHQLPRNGQYASLIGCMYFPWAWVVVNKTFREDVSLNLLVAAVGLPGLVPGLFLGRFILGQRVEDSPWILVLVTAIMLATGVWMIRLGPRRTVAWLIFVLFLSLIGSFWLNAGMRI